MKNLNETTKTISDTCLDIPVQTCAGRIGSIITSDAGTYMRLDGSQYWGLDDGYLHLRPEIAYTPAQIEAIKKINILYFAKKIIISNNLFRLRSTCAGETVERMDCPPLGSSFQKYFEKNENWLEKSEKIAEEKIYVC